MGNHHHHNNTSGKNLKIAFFINLGFTIFEIIGGIYTNSVAIMSDAIHDLGDSLSLGTSWYLEIRSKKKSDKKYSFGYARFSLLGALLNSVVLIVGSIFIINEAITRIIHPESSDATGMVFFAIVGIAVNGYAAWKLSTGKTMNEKVVSWHLLEDVLGWVAVLIVAIILYFKDIPYLDPALSLAITAYVLWNVIKRLRETLFLFLQGIPKDINYTQIEERILGVKHVGSMHHTHIWSLEGEHHVFTAHIKINDAINLDDLVKLKCEVKDILKEYPFRHYTIETELNNESCDLTEF
ncbi:MAG: cation diffusion facilitator family transporter [Bacteroidia bacterium]|nr:cation diffusion facilitator family transporter [Bacteroidia bacterium]